ncbi:MAG: PD40 domain-containing protein [Anaerolineae bacterium]|nr:PD40 domain-containing protein [Anaerolineae bacterium]
MLIRLGLWVFLALGSLLTSTLVLGRALPGGAQLLLEGESDGIHDLMLADVTRALTINLTRTPDTHEEHAAWSADGALLAFIRQDMASNQLRQVCIRRLPAAAQVCLPAVALWDDYPRWSPDGGRLLIESIDETFGAELYRLSIDDGSAEPLTRAAGNDAQASWSPDGRRIVFMTFREGLRKLYLMSSGGGPVRALTSPDSNAINPAWSPDGRRIAYVTDRDIGEEIYLIDVDCLDDLACDGASSRLTHLQALTTDLHWSSDGETLAFVSMSDGDFDVYTLEIESGDLRQWTHDPEVDEDPAWSPGGEALAFISSREGPYNVYIQTGPDSPAARLTDGKMNYWTPLWRPGSAN